MRRWFEIQNTRLTGSHNRSLKKGRHPAIGPVPRPIHRVAAWIGENNIGREALTFGSQPVGDPRPQRGAARLRLAGVHEPNRRLMTVDVRVHRTDERYV